MGYVNVGKIRLSLGQKHILNSHTQVAIFLHSMKAVACHLCLCVFSYFIKFIKQVVSHLVHLRETRLKDVDWMYQA